MNCDPRALIESARCYSCIPHGQQATVQIYLLCQWAQNSGTVECGAPSNYILLTGGSAAGFYIKLSPIKWERTGVFPPTIEFNGTGWDIILFGNVLYTSDVFPCTWIQVTGGLPVPTGVYYSLTAPTVTWTPNTEVAQWADITGNHAGDLATFQSTADAPTVLNLIFGSTGNLTAINNLDNLTALINLDVNINSLTALDITNCTALQNLICFNNPGITALTGIGTCSSLVTLNCNACGIIGTLGLNGLSNLVTAQCINNSITALVVTGCISLSTLDCSYNFITSLDVSTCIALVNCFAPYNNLTTLNVLNCTSLTNLYAFINSLSNGAGGSVNVVLVDMVTNNPPVGTIFIQSQAPAAPPDAGPPDGASAKTTLMGLGWVVTTD